MKLSLASALLLSSASVLSAQAFAEEAAAEAPQIAGNITLTSDYVFRGISQSSESLAVQGGFDYTHDSGFHAGVWSSSIDFDDDEATAELDYYAGYSHEFGDVSTDIGYVYYDYPGAGGLDYDYAEFYVKASYSFVTLSLNYSDDYFAGSGSFYYPAVSFSYDLPMGFSASAGVGYSSIDEEDTFGTDSYTDWNIKVARDFMGVGLSLTYTDTDLSTDECFGGSELCDGRLVFAVSKAL